MAKLLRDLDPLIDQLELALRPDGIAVFHEYIHWSTFGLHPHGDAIARFGRACQRSFREAGGDPDVNRRLPTLLAAQGWRNEELRPLPVLGGSGSIAARWLERFVAVYGTRLQQLGLWSDNDAEQATTEIQAAQTNPGSYWVGPTLLELRARKL